MAITLSGDIVPAGTFKIVDGSNIGGALTGSAVSASGNLYADLTDAAGSYNNTVVYDTATGRFYYTGSYGGGGAGAGFPFEGDAVITGSLEIVPGTGTGALTSSGAISASGTLYGGLSALSTTTVVTYQGSDGRLGTRTADAKIFGTNLVDKTGAPTQYQIPTFIDTDTIQGQGSFTYNYTDQILQIGGKSGFVDINGNLGSITASANISASGNIRAATLQGSLNTSFLAGTVDISSQTNLVAGTNLTLSNDTINLDDSVTLAGSATATNLIAGNNISGSGDLYASTSYASAGDYNNVVLYDTATGKFYHTGSYGGGGGATPTGPDNAIQFNDGGSLGGDSGFTYDNTSYADVKISEPTAAALHLSSSAGLSRIELTSATNQANYIRHQRGTGNTVFTGINPNGNYFVDDGTAGTSGIEFNVESGTNSITLKILDASEVLSLSVSASEYTASNIYAPNMSTGVDNSVVIRDSDGVLKTDEIDSRVWGSSLVDYSGTPATSQVAIFNDSNTISSGNTLAFTGGTLRIGGKAGVSDTHVLYMPPVLGSTITTYKSGIEVNASDFTQERQSTGEIFNAINSNSLTATEIVYYGKAGWWAAADAATPGPASGMLGLVINTGPTQTAALTKGYMAVAASQIGGTYTTGSSLYLGTSSGMFQASPPGKTGHTIRKVGWVVNGSLGKTGTDVLIHFNPSSDFITN